MSVTADTESGFKVHVTNIREAYFNIKQAGRHINQSHTNTRTRLTLREIPASFKCITIAPSGF